MDLTDEQRRRIEENRARAKARLLEKRKTQGLLGSAIDGGKTQASPPGEGGKRQGGIGGGVDAGGAGADIAAEGGGERDAGLTERPATKPAAAAAASRSTRSGGGGARGTRSGFGGRSGAACSSGDGAGAAAGVAIACEGCGGAEDDARADKELLEGFGITVCRTCKLSREEFQYVSTKEVKETYLLPQGTIAVLKFVERDNPHHSSWTKMKLYLRREVAVYSYKRWGSADGLAAERSRREGLQYDRSLARTKGMFKRSRSETEDDSVAGGFV